MIQHIITKQDDISKAAFGNYTQQGHMHLDSHKKRSAHSLFWDSKKIQRDILIVQIPPPHKNLSNISFFSIYPDWKLIRHMMIWGDVSAETCEHFHWMQSSN